MPKQVSWRVAAMVVAAAVVTAVVFYARGKLASPAPKLDAQWHRTALVDGNLAHWLAVAPSENGFLHANVTRDWRRREQKSTDLVAQSRLVYVLLSGYELTGDQRYLDAARNGVEFLLQYFRDPLYGGFFHTVDAQGRVVHDHKNSYGHAFAIFALAHAYRVTKDKRYSEAALNGWRAVSLGLRDEAGGLFIDASRDFARKSPGARTQNPVMHMFEAMLVLAEATGDPEALTGAQSIGKFALNRLVRNRPDGTSYIPEWYTETWEPLPREKDDRIDLGHQFEWAFLLSIASTQGLVGVYAEVGKRMLDYAIKVGYDELDGGTFNVAHPDGAVVREKGFWQQSECLRTVMRYAVLYGKPDMVRRYEQTLALVQSQFIDADNGGWYAMAKSACARQTCADEQPDAYHMTGMHREALRLAEQASQNR
jgi:mannobiose 2-epimerase